MAPRKSARKAKTKPVVENVASAAEVNEEQQVTELVTTLTPVTDADGNGTVRYYVDDQGRYYYGPEASEVEGMPVPAEELTHIPAPNTMMDNDKLIDLLKSTNEYIIVFQPSDETDENQIVQTQSQELTYHQEDGQEHTEIMIDPEMESPECVEMEEIEILEDGTAYDPDAVDAVATEEEEEGEELEELDEEEAEEKSAIYDFEEEEEDEAGIRTTRKIKTAKTAQQKKSNRKFSALYHCPNCAYSSSRKYLVIRHMKSHSEDRPYTCTYCDRKFKTATGWQNHLNTHKGHKPHVCSYCQTAFTTSGELVRHVRYKHTLEKPHKCNECDYASVELSKLKRHQRCHTGERPYQCRHCTYASPDTFKLKRHIRTHTGEKPYKCDECQLCFTQSNSLKNHKLIHNVAARPVFNCALCPATCGRKTDLRIHIKNLHSTQKPYKCKRCGKVFPDRYTFKVHNKSHDGEKCFKCDLCPYASSTVRHLKSHMLKHTGEKPFQCDECDQAFRQKQLLRRHENLYHNPNYVPTPPKEKSHECNKCRRQFAHKGNLIRHLAVHDPDNIRETLLTQPNEVTVETEMELIEEEEIDQSDNEEVIHTDAIYVNQSDDEGLEEQVVTTQPMKTEEDDEYLVFHVVQVDEDDNEGETTATIQLPIKYKDRKIYEKTSGVDDTCFGFASGEERDGDEIEGIEEEIEEEIEEVFDDEMEDRQEPIVLNLQFNDSN